MSDDINFQTYICPVCFDDHSQVKTLECIKKLKQESEKLKEENKKQFDLGYKYGVKEAKAECNNRIKLLEADVNSLSRVIERKEKENEKLRNCVEFYADENNWSKYGECEFTQKDIEDYTEIEWGHDLASSEQILVAQIGGKKARQTLKELGVSEK